MGAVAKPHWQATAPFLVLNGKKMDYLGYGQEATNVYFINIQELFLCSFFSPEEKFMLNDSAWILEESMIRRYLL